MKKYEIGIIVKPNLDDAAQVAAKDEVVKAILSGGGKILEEKDMGIMEMAYEIEKFKQGHYFFLIVESNDELNKEFTRLANISENVIRYLITYVDHVNYSTLKVLETEQKLERPKKDKKFGRRNKFDKFLNKDEKGQDSKAAPQKTASQNEAKPVEKDEIQQNDTAKSE